jgi:alpha-beta hydrolase superfamily lysophospholipase
MKEQTMTCTEFSWKSKRGLKIFAQSWQPDGPVRGTVGLVHGLGEHIGRYTHVASAFNHAGYALVGFDQPGHGQSEGKRGGTSFEETADEIDHLLEEMKALNPGVPQFLYGHSMGAAMSLYYGLKRRPNVRGIIATSPPLTAGSGSASQVKLGLLSALSKLAPGMNVNNGLNSADISRDPQVVKAYVADPLVHPQVSTRLGYQLLSMGSWITAHAGEFPVPLLLAHGTEDHICSYPASQALAKLIPTGKLTFKTWEGRYHETHNDPQKEEVIQYMIDWMDQYV